MPPWAPSAAWHMVCALKIHVNELSGLGSAVSSPRAEEESPEEPQGAHAEVERVPGGGSPGQQ